MVAVVEVVVVPVLVEVVVVTEDGGCGGDVLLQGMAVPLQKSPATLLTALDYFLSSRFLSAQI